MTTKMDYIYDKYRIILPKMVFWGKKINFGTPLNKPCLINLYLTTLSLLIAVPKHLQGGCIAI